MDETLPFRVGDLIDVTLVWLMVWAGVAWLRTTTARVALVGLAILGVFALATRQAGLVLTTWILQAFSAVSVLVAIVVFQPEIRRLFEQIAGLGRVGRRRQHQGADAIDTVVRALVALADQRRGALLVLPGHESLERHLDGGVPLGAEVSEPLLLSLFDPHSPGHDGAVVLEGDRLTRFAAHLPLSTDHAQLGQRGTRHAAALGLSERTDALCLVVSEERGSVSVARGGRLETLASPPLVGDRIRDFVRDVSPGTGERRRALAGVARHWREGVLALPISAALWFLAVPGAGRIEAHLDVPIEVVGLPESYELESVEPPTARVGVAGRRRDLFLLDRAGVSVRVDVLLVELGRRSFQISAQNVVHPPELEVTSVDPAKVRLSLRRQGAPAKPAAATP